MSGSIFFPDPNAGTSVGGPGSSTDNALARFDGTTGALLQNSTAILSDLGGLSLVAGDAVALSVASSSTTASAVLIAANLLTTGRALDVYSDAPNPSGRRLVSIVNDNVAAVGTIACLIQQDAAQTAFQVSQNADAVAFFVPGAASSTSPIMQVVGNSLTTAELFRATSNAANAGLRNTVFVAQEAAAATNARVLYLQQAGAAPALIVESNGANVAMDLIGTAGGAVRMLQAATVPGGAPGATKGEFWTRNDAVTSGMFTDSAGVDHLISPRFGLAFQSVATFAVITTYAAITGATVTLPVPGMYRVFYSCRSDTGTLAGQFIVARLFNVTAGAVINGSETISVFAPALIQGQGTHTAEVQITVTVATVVNLEARFASATGTGSNTVSNADGRTSIGFNSL